MMSDVRQRRDIRVAARPRFGVKAARSTRTLYPTANIIPVSARRAFTHPAPRRLREATLPRL